MSNFFDSIFNTLDINLLTQWDEGFQSGQVGSNLNLKFKTQTKVKFKTPTKGGAYFYNKGGR